MGRKDLYLPTPGRHVGRDGAARPNVVRALALLAPPAAVQDQVERGTPTPATAYEVFKLDDPADQADVAPAS